MKREIVLTLEPIDEAALLAAREKAPDAGAAVYFAGVVRATEGESRIAALDYEAFDRMARHQIGLIFDRAEKRWPLKSVRLTHRLGRIAAGETSLWVEATSAHRREAFEACQFIIDEMKRDVPIWKKPFAG